jgi:hypothetical protein
LHAKRESEKDEEKVGTREIAQVEEMEEEEE